MTALSSVWPTCHACARVAERLLQSQSTNAILTTFNEVNMAPSDGHAQEVFQPSSKKSTAASWAFMSFLRAAVHALKNSRS